VSRSEGDSCDLKKSKVRDRILNPFDLERKKKV